ncbi:MAG: hypothetical protein Q9172_007596 [Xanthocarpia lactea]
MTSPTTATALRNAWAEVLDVDPEDIKDDSNFISLGGDSVSAIQLASIASNHGLDLSMEAIFREGVFSALLSETKLLDPTQAQQQEEDITPASATTDTQLIQTCADACGIPPDMISDIYPPVGTAGYFFTQHQETGAWLLQIVFQLTGNIDPTLVCRAFETIHDRNDTFRSRFVQINGEVQNIVTKCPIVWQKADNLQTYKSTDRSQKVTPGQPAVRYALIEEPETTYIVWTALHSAMDGWTRKLLCDDLQSFLLDPDTFTNNNPKRPSMRKYLDFLKTMDPAASTAFWDHYLSGTPPPNPLKGSTPFAGQPTCNQKILREFPIQKRPTTTKTTSIRLSNIAHTAFALLLGSYTSTTDVFFFGIRASRTIFPGAEKIMGSVFSPVPIRIRYSPTEPIGDVLQRVQDESNAMMPHEPFGGLALFNLLNRIGQSHSITFQWFPRGTDLAARVMSSTSRTGEEGTVRVVEEKYSPHTIPGCLNAYDNGDCCKVSAEYDDRIFGDGFMDGFVQRFSVVLDRICRGDGSEIVESLLET